MDARLLAWGMAGRRMRGDGAPVLPRLWLFTDSVRLPDPCAAAERLPRGGAGIIFRHDDAPDRAALAGELSRVCRRRRLVLVIAGDAELAARLHAGVHLRGGRGLRPRRAGTLITSSAHGIADLRRAVRAGAGLAFLSPVFTTASHPGAGALGPIRWAAMARCAPRSLRVAALGGIDGGTVRRLPGRWCGGIGAIGALA
jgi:thiamine-phosphate pyrophosphorylase